MPDEETGLWYYTIISEWSNAKHGNLQETYGPFHKQYIADQMMNAKIESLKKDFVGPGIRTIFVVPPAQAVEIALLKPDDYQPDRVVLD